MLASHASRWSLCRLLIPAHPRPILQADCARWCIVWQFAVHQNSTGATELHPTAVAQLTDEELAVMRASTKTRVTAANRVRRLIVAAGLTEGEASRGGGHKEGRVAAGNRA